MSQSFKYGSISFPLDPDSGNTLLRDADPAIYYGLEFLASVLNSHIGPKLVAEAIEAGAPEITSAVVDSMPIDPEQFLTAEHLRFPLLTLHRESSSFKFVSQKRIAIHKLRCAYVLPPLRAAQAERLLPVLHAAALVIDQKCSDGRDDDYTPTLPTGTAGEFIWTTSRAGVAKCEVKDSATGAFQISNELFFPAVVLSLEMWEVSTVDATDGTFPDFEGADGNIGVGVDGEPFLEPVIEVSTYQAPTVVSLAPTSGSASGGTTVTITGTRFRPDTRPIVLFDGAAADAVAVVNETSITCRTPPHAAYPSFIADVLVIASDGQVGTLEQAFTFNNP